MGLLVYLGVALGGQKVTSTVGSHTRIVSRLQRAGVMAAAGDLPGKTSSLGVNPNM